MHPQKRLTSPVLFWKGQRISVWKGSKLLAYPGNPYIMGQPSLWGIHLYLSWGIIVVEGLMCALKCMVQDCYFSHAWNFIFDTEFWNLTTSFRSVAHHLATSQLIQG
jgi:hypothetical protein